MAWPWKEQADLLGTSAHKLECFETLYTMYICQLQSSGLQLMKMQHSAMLCAHVCKLYKHVVLPHTISFEGAILQG